MWIKETQQAVFTKEINNIKSKTNRLPLARQLQLFLDKSVLIHCGGRIHNAPTTELAKFPYLLPSKHLFTKLVIYSFHEKQLRTWRSELHSDSDTAVLLDTFSKTDHKEATPTLCNLSKGSRETLPNTRSTSTHQGDNAECSSLPVHQSRLHWSIVSLYVRDRGDENKVYICLFTCAISRAVHLEIVTDISVETFLEVSVAVNPYQQL